MKPRVYDVNHELAVVPEKIIPLVGLDQLPPGFKFRVNMFDHGVRCHAVISVDCLVEWFHMVVGGVCEQMMHHFIQDQLYGKQISLCCDRDYLSLCMELFIKHDSEFQHFDAPTLLVAGAES